MSKIITLKDQQDQMIMAEVNAVLAKYGKALSPSVTMSMTGMTFHIAIVDVKVPSAGGGNSHG